MSQKKPTEKTQDGQGAPFRRTSKVVPAKEAGRLIKDGDTVATGGFCGAGFAEDLAIHLEERYLETKKPKGLTLVYAAGQGDYVDRGLNHFGQEGLVRKAVGGFYGAAPKLSRFVIENKIEAHNFPQGVISHIFRDIAAHKPRTITTIGLETFVDPRYGGGKTNAMTTDDLVELVEFDGKEYLAYKTFPIDVALLRGTTADENGNVTLEKEALTLEVQAMAMAAKNSGGIVIVQVERVVQAGTLPPKQVEIPGILVDCVVVARPEYHWQTFAEVYNPSYSGELKIPTESIPPLQLNDRKVIARRAAFELSPADVVNLGIGMPEGVSSVANEEGIFDQITLTAEPGVIGGLPAGGLSFGAATNTDAIVDQPAQFDFYHGGGLDITFLGLAQADRHGNLNVSRFGPKLAGAGGFIDISQSAKRVVFLGTFTASGLKVAIGDGKLKILQEGKVKKFLKDVEQITFSGAYAVKRNQPVLFVTERCVLRLTDEGLVLTEIAPGVDLETDILANMEFKPVIKKPPRMMDERIFRDEPMKLIDSFI
jgi:propionate CoA-transferase